MGKKKSLGAEELEALALTELRKRPHCAGATRVIIGPCSEIHPVTGRSHTQSMGVEGIVDLAAAKDVVAGVRRTDRPADLGVGQPLAGGFSLSAGVGYDEIADPSGTGYGFWNAGVAYAWGPVQVQAGYSAPGTAATR